MRVARKNDPVTPLEALTFATAVIGPPWALGVLIASLYVAGPAFLLLLVPVAFQPVSLLAGAAAVVAVTALVVRVQDRWTRPEIALVSSGLFAAALWFSPVALVGDLDPGAVLGLILVVLAVAFGPIPLCFWSATRAARSMRIGVRDPAAASWLRDAVAWGMSRFEMIRARALRPPGLGQVRERR
ncbi:hypothetical protein KV097_14195 [Mumia sp. zg.B17]|uniref:hypothetical protein n=1 Tax=Mumia sp. zg.B17 TaxID=2855446 RepID=UPI001C6EC0EE|nr:hypothetical protein [Mumia sp. zg.B17]MBW9207094.1 hypothetical protein [Mumia sp. zg.B17]